MAINILQALMQGANAPILPPSSLGSDIEVHGRVSDPRPLGNRTAVEEVRDASGNLPQRTGLFGIKGTLRDVLGTLGDSFLIGSGHNPIFQPQRQRERESDALIGLTEDPLAAVERLADINPQAAQQLFNNVLQRQNQQAQLQSLTGNRQSQIEDRNQKNILEVRNVAARMLSAAGNDPAKMAYATKEIGRLAGRLGLTSEDLGITEDLTPEQAAIFAQSDMTVQQQQQLPIREKQLELQERNTRANETRANRAPQPRATPNPTAASIAAPLLEKLASGETLSSSEDSALRATGLHPDRFNSRRGGSTTRPRPSPAQAGQWGKARVIN